MNEFTNVVADYIALWNETDADARATAAAKLWEADGSYVDPAAEVTGPDGIAGLVGAVQEQFPGLVFRLAGDIDAHHRIARFRWELGTPSEPDMVIGFDVAELSAAGKLQRVLGFLDKVPA